jgi:hypothetical protein
MPLSRIGTNSITDFAVEATDLANNSIETYTSNTGRPLTNRNLVINGAMQVSQRNTSVTGITSGGYYTADRWPLSITSAGTWTMNIESSSPVDTEFRNSANIICTTADSSLSPSDLAIFQQRIEGQNLQVIKKGTAGAESLTISFYVKSSNTGTYICEFFDEDNTRQISKSYTINNADTWEKKIITVPPDTTGRFDNDNANSFNLFFWLAAGSDRTSGTLNSSTWAPNTNANRVVGQLNLANRVGNYWAATGIQLETGTVATPFEMRSYATELVLCQRYFERIGSTNGNGPSFPAYMNTGNVVDAMVSWKVQKRAAPTVTGASGSGLFGGEIGSTVFNTNGFGGSFQPSEYGCRARFVFSSGSVTSAQAGYVNHSSTSAWLAASSEL